MATAYELKEAAWENARKTANEPEMYALDEYFNLICYDEYNCQTRFGWFVSCPSGLACDAKAVCYAQIEPNARFREEQ